MIQVKFDAAELSRLVLYRLLALALYEPSKALDDMLESEQARTEIAQAAQQLLGDPGTKSVQAMLDAFHQTADSIDLKVEYNRLFVGPAAPRCPPYESVYDQSRTSEELGTTMGPAAEEIQKALRAENLGVILDHAELEDHAAIELEFMVYLMSRALQATPEDHRYADRAVDFRNQHLTSWLADFGCRVAKEAKHPFYREVGHLLEKVIEA